MAEEHSSVWLIRDEEHSRATHRRWVARRNRDTGDPDYKEEWYGEQCGDARSTCRSLEVRRGLGSMLKREIPFRREGCL